MKIPFDCPSCAASGSVDAAAAGKTGRCRHCGHRFTIPIPGPAAVEPDVFPLDGPARTPVGDGYAVMDTPPASTFVPTLGDESADATPRRAKRSAARSSTRRAGRRASRPAWARRLAGAAGAFAIVIASIALFAPGGRLIAACAVIVIGCGMILAGYAVGAYGAFSEDFVHGFLYLVIPPYTAYYMATRWDDLWFWFACMTLGVGIVLIGIEVARWGGVVV